jgi:hypothetical protein
MIFGNRTKCYHITAGKRHGFDLFILCVCLFEEFVLRIVAKIFQTNVNVSRLTWGVPMHTKLCARSWTVIVQNCQKNSLPSVSGNG